MNKLWLFVWCVFAAYGLKAQTLEFIGEEIDFSVEKQTFNVNGLYYFVNPLNKTLRPSIFFPVDSLADSLQVTGIYNYTYQEEIEYTLVAGGIYFSFMIVPDDTVCVNISYQQKLSPRNIYILTSTMYWEQPLNFASYTFSADSDLDRFSFEIKPDSLAQRIYYWRRKDFLPVKDFVVYYK